MCQLYWGHFSLSWQENNYEGPQRAVKPKSVSLQTWYVVQCWSERFKRSKFESWLLCKSMPVGFVPSTVGRYMPPPYSKQGVDYAHEIWFENVPSNMMGRKKKICSSWLLEQVWNIKTHNLFIFSREKIPRILNNKMVQGGDLIS